MRIWIAACLFVAWAGPALGQTEQRPAFQTGIDLLSVDVSVVGSNGEPVSDLGAPEFIVKVDGQVRTVVSAEFVSFDERNPRTDPAPADSSFYSSNQYARPGRLIVIVVDQSHILLGAMQPLRNSVSQLLDRLGPADRVSFVTIPELGPQVEFTNNFDRIREAVGRVTGRVGEMQGRYAISLSDAITLARGGGLRIAVAQILDRECDDYPEGSRFRELCEREVVYEAEAVLREARMKTAATLRALRDTIEDLKDIDGPKSLIFISQGLVTERDESDTVDLGPLAAAARVSVHVLLLEQAGLDASVGGIPTTPERDRERLGAGLASVAGASGGELSHVVGSGEGVFERIQRQLSAYYLLGVEATPVDRDGKPHQITVEVRRRNVVVRSRREFREVSAPSGSGDATERALGSSIRSPVIATDLPLRVTSYAFQDATTDQIRLLVAGEVGDTAAGAGPYALGLALFDRMGTVVTTQTQTVPVDPAVARPNGSPLTYAAVFLVEPGTYTLKVAAVDDQGHRGSVEHVTQAWQMAGLEFAMSDLMLSDALRPGEKFQPAVAARVASGQLVSFVELYAKDQATLDQTRVTFEIAGSESAAALTSGVAELRPTQSTGRLEARALLPVAALPPGTYVARAIVSRDGRTVGATARPFVVSADRVAAAAPGTPASVPPPGLGAVDFDRSLVLEPDVLGYFVDRVAKKSPAGSALDATMTRVRQGKFDGAAREAFDLDDQYTAAFLRGLELYTQQKLNEAATQFRTAAGPGSADSVPASFFLGACFAAAGRDGEATQLWARTLQEENLPAAVYRTIGDAWLRLGNPLNAVNAFKRAAARGADAEALRRLGIVLAEANRPAEAIASLDAYLARHPRDPEALFAAIQALYAARSAGQPVGSPSEDRARAARYADAYRAANGPKQALVDTWADFFSQVAR